MQNFKNSINPKIKNHIKIVNESKSKIDTSLFNIQTEFMAENINSNESLKTKKYNNQFVRTDLIGLSGKGANTKILKDTLAESDLDKDNQLQFFNNGNVNRITQVCNNVNLRTNLIKFLGNKKATVKLVVSFLSQPKYNIKTSTELNNSCMKDGIFSNSKKESKAPSGATNQTDSKSDNEVSIEQELKIESKSLVLKLLADIYPTFKKLNSKDMQLCITKLSNAKNLNMSVEDFIKDLKNEDKKQAI